MQATQHGVRYHLRAPRWASPLRRLARDSLPNTLVRSRMVKVPLTLSHDPVQVSLTQDQDVVQALPPHTAQKSFADRICSGRRIRCP
jgi:hypothetical protein